MSGVRLEAKVLIVTGAVSSAQNIVKCAQRTGLNVADIVLQPLASSLATLSEDEKELGVCLVDIGGGTTDIAIFANGAILHTAVLALGGNHLTNDVAVGLRTPTHEAERIKKAYGCAMASMVDRGETIEVPSVGGGQPRVLSRQILAEIIEPRVEEIFMLVQHEIQKCGLEEAIASGVVITGGSTLLSGMTEMAEEVLGVPVRRGMPKRHRRARRRGEEPDVRHRGGARDLRGPAAGRQPVLQDPRGERLPQGQEPHEGLAGRDLLAPGEPT